MSVCRLNRYQQPKRFCVEQKSAAKNSAQSTKTTATAVEKERARGLDSWKNSGK